MLQKKELEIKTHLLVLLITIVCLLFATYTTNSLQSYVRFIGEEGSVEYSAENEFSIKSFSSVPSQSIQEATNLIHGKINILLMGHVTLAILVLALLWVQWKTSGAK